MRILTHKEYIWTVWWLTSVIVVAWLRYNLQMPPTYMACRCSYRCIYALITTCIKCISKNGFCWKLVVTSGTWFELGLWVAAKCMQIGADSSSQRWSVHILSWLQNNHWHFHPVDDVQKVTLDLTVMHTLIEMLESNDIPTKTTAAHVLWYLSEAGKYPTRMIRCDK